MKLSKIFFSFCLITICLFTFLPKTFTSAQTIEKDMLLVFDASGSMSEQFGGTPRIDALKTAVGSLLDSLDSLILVGLRPFANIKNADQVQACKITSLAQNFTTERSIIKTQTSLLQAVGSYTPLAYTLTVSGGDFKVGNDNVLILLTDGKDTCGGDPVKSAGELFNSDKKVKIYVIGMGVDTNTKAQLSAISTAGGGVYYDASDSSSLATSLKAIQNLEKPIDRTNTDILLGTAVRGGTGFNNAITITSGVYRLDHNLAPKQYDYFKLSVKKGDSVYFKTYVGDRDIKYNKVTNSFEDRGEGSSYIYLKILDSDRVDIGIVQTFGRNKKDEKTIEIKQDGIIFIKIGSDWGEISKYNTFTISVNGEATTASVDTTTTTQNINSPTDGSNGTQNTNNTNSASNNTNVGTNNGSRDNSSSNNLIYILFGVIIVLIIIIGVVLFILLKKKNNPSNNFPPTSNIPPQSSI
jgi:hypothetical protein